MALILYNKDNQKIFEVSPSDNSTLKHDLMGESVMNLTFSSPEYRELQVGDYAMFDGDKFLLAENYQPMQKSTLSYEYSPKLYGFEGYLKRVLMINLTDDAFDADFALDGSVLDHVTKLVDNLNRLGLSIKIGDVIDTDQYKTIDYKGVMCSDAVKLIAEAFDTEWWFDGVYFNLTKCERDQRVELGYLSGLTSLSCSSNDNVRFFTRLIPLGSTRNIDRNKYKYKRLQLPDRAKYVERNTHYGLYEAQEENAFAHIYPRRIGTVSEVRVEDKTIEGVARKVYYFKDASLDFDPNKYELPGLVKNIVFQSGTLNGRDFECNYNSTTKEFEIINVYPTEDSQLPGSSMIPRIGDQYILYNITMPDAYYTLAENEYKTAVDAFIDKYSEDMSVYKASSDYIYFMENNLRLKVGSRIRLRSEQYFSGYRDTRVVSISRKINNPYKVDIECASVVGQSKLESITSSVDELKRVVTEYNTNPKHLEIIKTWDTTEPSNYNVFSALKAQQEHKKRLRKDVPDTAEKLITFLEGIKTGDMRSLDYLYKAIGWAMNKEGDLDANSAILRKSLTVPQIIFDTIKAIGGKFWFTDTHTIAKVTRSGSTYLCEVDLQPNTHCTWDKDDCLTGILHTTDAEGNFNGFQTVECLVISVENDIATLAPRVEALPPSIGLVLNRCGNITNVKRQSSVFLSAEMGGYVTLVNMNSWTIGRNNIGAATGDLSKLASILSMPELNGVSMLAKNVVLYGKYYQIDDITGDYHPVPNFQKEWVRDRVYSYYDEVTHLGRRFLCIDEKGCVGVEPYKGSAVWVCTVDKGEDGDKWNYCDKWEPSQVYKRGDVVLYGRDTYMYQWDEPSQGYYPDAAEYYPMSIQSTSVRVMNAQGAYVSLNVKTQRNRVWALMAKGGIDGDAAFSKQYSPDKIIIHTEYIEGDVYSRDNVNNAGWSKWYPLKGESANEPNFMFKYSPSTPTLPSATASIEQMLAAGWHDVPPTPRPEGQNLYQVYAKFNEYGNIIASWSEPYTPDGKDGSNGFSVSVKYATTENSNDWHYPMRVGDEWEKQSEDGGKTWSIAYRCVGEKGDKGDMAPYPENQYIKHNSFSIPPSQDADGWQDEPFTVIEEGVYIWKRERRVVPPAPPGSWGAPYGVSGQKGEDGESMNPKGDWSVNTKYNKNDVVTFDRCTFIALQDVPLGRKPIENIYRAVAINGSNVTVQGGQLSALTSGSDYWQKITDKPLDTIIYSLESTIATVVFNSLGNPTPTAYSVYLKKLVNGESATSDNLWLVTRYFDGAGWRRHGNAQLATSTSVTVRADAQQYETRVYAAQFDAEDWKDNYLSKNSVARADSGKAGEIGNDGLTPEIRNGYWWIGNTNTGIKAQAVDGITPHIGSNGNWWVGNQDTGIPATGSQGDRGPTGSMPRPCGFFAQGTTYMWDAKFQDWVIHPIGGINYQFMVRTFGATVTAAPTSAEGDSNWDVASKTKFVATDTALIDKANIAGFIYYNDYMISQWGKLNGVKKHISELLTSADWAAFVPNIKLDGKNGEVVGAGGQFMVDQDGNITAKSGEFGFMNISGSSIKSTNIELTNRALPSLQDMSQATDTHPVTTSTKSGSGNLYVEVSTSIASIYLSKPQVISLVANGECYSSDRNYQSIFSFAQVSVTDAQGINMGSQTVAHGATSEEDVFSRGASFTLSAGRYTVHLTGNASIMQPDKAVSVTAKMTITNLRIEAISSTTLIGNNGFASHFASDKYIYFNSQEKIEFRYGNYGFQITETGLRKMTNGSSWVTL